MPDKDDFLLYSISSWQKMSWQTFKNVFDTLYSKYQSHNIINTNEIVHIRRRMVRTFDALAHCDIEFNTENGTIYSSPVAFARLPTRGISQVVLCGSRGPHNIKQLRDTIKVVDKSINIIVEGQANTYGFVPRRVMIEASSADIIAQLAKRLQIRFSHTPTAWSIANYSGSMETYLASCQWQDMKEPNWSQQSFNHQYLQFQRDPQNKEIRLVSYENPAYPKRIHYLWQGSKAARVDLDWGRYAILGLLSVPILLYDETKFTLAVPVSVPLPRLLARAAALCSGYAPRYVERTHIRAESAERRGFNIYTQVPPDIANLIASKLSQRLSGYTMDL